MADQYLDPTTFTSLSQAYSGTIVIIPRDVFKSQLLDDLDNVFYNNTEFAEVISFIHADGTIDSITVIFDEESMALDVQTGAKVLSDQPMFSFPRRQLTKDAREGDTALIRNREYVVESYLPDGTGKVEVILRRD